jgi:hypothetical protein
MNKKLYSKFKIKDKVLRNELARAHGMIILLVAALMLILGISNTSDTTFDPTLTLTAIILLGVVGLLSLSVIASILTKRK